MSLSHVGYYSAVRFHDVHQLLYVAGMTRSHLHYSDFVFRFQSQQRLRHTDVVVEVSLGIQYIVFLLQHRRHEFLCRRLSVGPGDADNLCSEFPAVVVGELLQCLQTVVHEYESLVVLLGEFLFVYHGEGASFVNSLLCEGVSVERRSFEREEDGVFRAVAAVGSHHGVLLEDSVQFRYFHDFISFV